jgi:TrmH RNA methyltransferase
MSDHRPRRPGPPADSPWRNARRPPDTRIAEEPAAARPPAEQRLYGLNACLAAFARRPDDLRKVYLLESRIPALKPVLAWCVQHRLGYRVVAAEDLDKLTGSRHHEGVCFDLRRRAPLSLDALLALQPAAGASLLIWLDGVGNPHNLGAVLRSAAHFGAGGVIVPAASSLDLSGAAARVAEGGAEAVPLARIDDTRSAFATLRRAGYAIGATVPREGTALYEAKLPQRLLLVFGAEGEGMDRALVDAADLRLTIPGSGAVESLNIAASAAVTFAEWWRQVRANR